MTSGFMWGGLLGLMGPVRYGERFQVRREATILLVAYDQLEGRRLDKTALALFRGLSCRKFASSPHIRLFVGPALEEIGMQLADGRIRSEQPLYEQAPKLRWRTASLKADRPPGRVVATCRLAGASGTATQPAPDELLQQTHRLADRPRDPSRPRLSPG